MKYILILYLLFSSSSLFSQMINWQKASNWKLYKVSGRQGLGYTLDTLQKYPNVNIPEDSIHKYVTQAERMSKENPPVWMGAYYVTCIIDSNIHKIDISVYGGFFYDEFTRQFYKVPEKLIDEWMSWLIKLKKRANQSSNE